MIHSVLILLIVTFSGFVCYFLALIAKFYRLKSGNGLHHNYYYFTAIVLITGQTLSLEVLPVLIVQYISTGLVVVGGTGFIILTLSLYKSMMSVNKSMG